MKRPLVLLLFILAAACGREGASPTNITGGPSATPRATAKAGQPQSTGGSAATPDPSPNRAQTAAARATTAPARTPAPATAAASLVRPQVGPYGFHDKGTMRAGSTGRDQPYERDGQLTVSESGVRTVQRFQTDQGSEELTLRYEQARAFLERARIEQSFATFDARFDPPQLVLKAPLKVGDAWANTWKSDGTSGTTKIRVDREEPIRAFGKLWRSYVIVNDTTASGDAKGTTKSSSWYVAELGLDVKRISDFDGAYRGIAVKQHSERVLTSRP
jgi:hypothetical protein